MVLTGTSDRMSLIPIIRKTADGRSLVTPSSRRSTPEDWSPPIPRFAIAGHPVISAHGPRSVRLSPSITMLAESIWARSNRPIRRLRCDGFLLGDLLLGDLGSARAVVSWAAAASSAANARMATSEKRRLWRLERASLQAIRMRQAFVKLGKFISTPTLALIVLENAASVIGIEPNCGNL